MPAQNREAKRSYIDLVRDETERPDVTDLRPGPSRSLRDYLRGLLADAIKVRDVAR
jgi:hypothetical protein